MHILIGLLIGLFALAGIIVLRLSGSLFGRVLMFLSLLMVTAGIAAMVGIVANGMTQPAGPAAALLTIIVGSVLSWFIAGIPTYRQRRLGYSS